MVSNYTIKLVIFSCKSRTNSLRPKEITSTSFYFSLVTQRNPDPAAQNQLLALQNSLTKLTGRGKVTEIKYRMCSSRRLNIHPVLSSLPHATGKNGLRRQYQGENSFKGRGITFPCFVQKHQTTIQKEPLGTSQAASFQFPLTFVKLQTHELAGPRWLPSLLLIQTDIILTIPPSQGKKAAAQRVFCYVSSCIVGQ